MSGEKELNRLLQNMKPMLNDGAYVFTTVTSTEHIPRSIPICEIKEREGTTIVLSQSDAERFHLPYDSVVAWITLQVHSSLDAVGLTAVISTKLSKNGISCNLVAGYYHDHLFVPIAESRRALHLLRALTSTQHE